MRLNQETLVEKLHSDWEKQQNKERYVPDKARQRRKISHEPNQVNKHHDAETNLNQTSAVPPHLSQAIDIDKESEESALCMLSLSSLMEKLKKQKGNKNGRPGFIGSPSAAPAKELAQRSIDAHVSMCIAHGASVPQMSPTRQQTNPWRRFQILTMMISGGA
ncbi:hypothetical protein RJZ57_002687 [Blastomyces gilchristii]